MKRQMDFDNFYEYPSIQKMSKYEFNDYLRSFTEIECIHDMRRIKENNSYQVIYEVEFKDADEHEWIDAKTLKRDYPQKLCEFYETCISWE